MLRVGVREDGRMATGLRFGGRMEENELEEGEACSEQEGEGLSPEKDLTSLSYIDEKLKDVLGHFQKDFEGGFSAENLGTMFGGYGSFLPMYQRSPSILRQPRSPPNASSHNGSKSPYNPLCEGARQSNSVSACTPVNKTSATTTLFPDKSSKKGLGMCSLSARASVPQHDSINKFANGGDQKTLKVRLKVGPESMLARNNAALYSGLGLEISPSSSPDGSPYGSEEFSTELRDGPDESPTSIIQIMTCFPVPGGYLLSPLPDSLLHLTEKTSLRNFKTSKINMGMPESCADITLSARDEKGHVQKKTQSREKRGKTKDVKNSKYNNDISSILKRDIDIETLAGQVTVSDALNIPILVDSRDAEVKEEESLLGESAKGFKVLDHYSEHNKNLNHRTRFSEPVKGSEQEVMEGIESIGVSASMGQSKGKLSSKTSVSMQEERNSNSHKDGSDVQKDGRGKTETFHSTKDDDDENKGRKDHNFASTGPANHSLAQETNLYEGGGDMISHGRDHLSEGKGKLNKSQTNGTPSFESAKKVARAHSSALLKEKKNRSHTKGDYSEIKSKELKSENEHVENRVKVVQTKDILKETKYESEDPPSRFSEKAKERSTVKKMDNPLNSRDVVTAPIVPLTSNIPASDAVAALNAPVLIKEHWVCCDRCQKWRLLPYGANPALLPTKWQCSMLDWLAPGMNRCNISEEETTKALNALYQLPLPQSNTIPNGVNDVAAPSITLDGVHHLNHTVESNVAMPAIGKKKPKSRDQANIVNDLTLIQGSMKKRQQASVQSRSLHDVSHPFESDPFSKSVVDYASKSFDFISNEQNHKHKEKNRIPGHHSDEGDFGEHVRKHSKSKKKREADQDSFSTPKKSKKGSHYVGEEWHSDHDGTGNAVLMADNGLVTDPNKHHVQNYIGSASSKEAKCDSQSNLIAYGKRAKAQTLASGNGEAEQHLSAADINKPRSEITKKRKTKDWQESQGYQANSSRLSVDSKVDAIEAFSENELKREKKHKVLKSEVKGSSTCNKLDNSGQKSLISLSSSRQHPSYAVEENTSVAVREHQVEQQRQENTTFRQASEGAEFFKKDFTYAQPSAAATSSSSKISGSRKSRCNFQEVRGSPVESVSSSPFRNSNSEKPIPSRRKLGRKDDVPNAGFLVIGTPKNYSDGEIDAGSRHPKMKKEKSARQKSIEGQRAVDSQVLDCLSGKVDYVEKDAKTKEGIHLKLFGDTDDALSPTEFEGRHMVNNGTNESNQYYKCEPVDKVNSHHLSNGFGPRKSGKNSLHSKERPSFKYAPGKGKMKVSRSLGEQEGQRSSKNDHNSEVELYNNSQDWSNSCKENYCQQKEDNSQKKELMIKASLGGGKDHGIQGNMEVHGSSMSKQNREIDSRISAPGASCGKSTVLGNQQASHMDERNLFSQSEVASGRGKSPLIVSSTDKQDIHNQGPQVAPTPVKGGKSGICPTDATNEDAMKVTKSKRPDDQNGGHHGTSRQALYSTPDSRSPGRRDGQSAASVLKEARDLKHTANRLKNEGLVLESTGLYFQAALKFLHYASLLEPQNVDSAKMYSETALLCEFCAREYEKCKEMASAALAYKCVEVAYMKVSYFKHSSASSDRLELQTTLQMALPGESPSSSASDVDNLNNQGALDKSTLGKGVSSPHVAGNHIIAARNRPNFVRLLNYANETICAFEASKKMYVAFAAATAGLDKDIVGRFSSVREVLDFNFHNVERLLQLIRLSIESIS